jgi:hypothetical protein
MCYQAQIHKPQITYYCSRRLWRASYGLPTISRIRSISIEAERLLIGETVVVIRCFAEVDSAARRHTIVSNIENGV